MRFVWAQTRPGGKHHLAAISETTARREVVATMCGRPWVIAGPADALDPRPVYGQYLAADELRPHACTDCARAVLAMAAEIDHASEPRVIGGGFYVPAVVVP